MSLTRKFMLSSSTSLFAAFTLSGLVAAQTILPNNLVVVRIGDGSAALTSAATGVFLEQYTTAGAPVGSPIALPTTASLPQRACTNSGSASSEGFLNLSANGQYLVTVGYDAAAGTASVVGTANPTTNRVIARTDLAGNVDTTTALTDAFSANNIRSATSDNGTQFWAAGANSGIRYVAALGATTSTQLNTTSGPTNNRVVTISGGQLYSTSASGAFQGVSSVGTGLPTTAPATYAILPGMPIATGPSAYDHFFADANTVYVSDDRTTGAGGIQKWTLSGGTWTLQYTLAPALNVGCRGITGQVNGTVATLYATTTQASLNSLVTVTDTGSGSLFTTLSTAATNMRYAGVRFIAPSGPVSLGTPECFGNTVTDCPCSGSGGSLIPNPGATGNGCANSVFAAGAQLTAMGNAVDNAGDTVVLSCSNMTGPGLFFQSNATISFPNFDDGKLCAAVGIIRLGVVFPTGNVGIYPGGTTPAPIHIAGAPVLIGGSPTPATKHYQCWYRDNTAGFCNSQGDNTSNGLAIVWAP